METPPFQDKESISIMGIPIINKPQKHLLNRFDLRLCIVVYLLALPMVTQAQIKAIKPFGKIRALVIGISDYEHPKISDLSFADRDAQAFATFLEQETAWKVAPEDIVLLTNEQATYGQFLSELEALTENAQAKDRLIIYFSGHGDIEVVSDEKRGYLLFYDASPTTYASGGACMVNTLDGYINQLVLEKDTEVILISDACRSGSLAGSKIGGPKATTAALSSLFINTVKILSCEPDQFSVEDEKWGNGRGLFSYYLVNGLKGLADENENLYVDKFEIENYLRTNVRRESELRQIPMISGGLSSLRLARVDPALLEKVKINQTPLLVVQPQPSAQPDTSALVKFTQFEQAIQRKQLMFPAEGSAYAVYQSMSEAPQDQAFKKVMKISLTSALQNEAQQALNEYITSPGKEVAKRWKNSEIYARYPAYLETAAELLGEDNYFYADVMSRAYYFKGVNQRLAAEAGEKADSSLYLMALAEQQKALQLQPIAPHIYNEMGLIYRELNQIDQEVENFQKACALSPNWALALTNLATTYQAMKKYDLAEKSFLNAIDVDEDLSLAHYNLAVLYEEMNQVGKAESAYLAAVQKKDPVPDAYYNLGYIQMEKSPPKNEEALVLIAKYIELVPDDIDAYSLMAYIYNQEQRLEEAIDILQNGLRIQPEDAYALSQLAFYSRNIGDLEEAIQSWEKIIAFAPDDQNAYLQLARIQALKNNQKAAIETLDQLLKTGYQNQKTIEEQMEFEVLKTSPEFQALMKRYFPNKD